MALMASYKDKIREHAFKIAKHLAGSICVVCPYEKNALSHAHREN
jgi:hypothetical protein